MMDQHFYMAFGAALIAAAVTTAGIHVICRFENWGRQNTTYFALFAAGVLIAVSFLHIIPTALVMTPIGPACILAGYLFMHIFNRFVTAYVCDKPSTAEYGIGLVPLLGIGFHSFLDGAIYSITFTVSPFTGVLSAIGMVLHEFPEGIVTYLLLLRGGFPERRALIWAFVAAALSTPLGMLVSFPFVNRIDAEFLGVLLSLSAGTLVYVGATHLLPAAEREPRQYSLIALGAGILVAFGIVVAKG